MMIIEGRISMLALIFSVRLLAVVMPLPFSAAALGVGFW